METAELDITETQPDCAANVCEHGDHPAPKGQRFCSDACQQCEFESHGFCSATSAVYEEETGCDGICSRDALTDEGGAFSVYAPMSETRWYIDREERRFYVYNDTLDGAKLVLYEGGFLLGPDEPALDTEPWETKLEEGLTFREKKKKEGR